MAERDYDIVIFGATGVTGVFVFEELARVAKKENVKYALAARNEEKLKCVVEKAKKYLESVGETIEDVPLIIADVGDEKSLLEMCQKTKVIINCVGPYNLYGESVVKACIESGTHHVDVSGEPVYLEQMQLKYHDEAKKKGVYIVGACGFDSIPCDVGVTLVKKKFQGDLNSVETFLEFHSNLKDIGTGTWESIIYGVILGRHKLHGIRKGLNESIYKRQPKYAYPVAKRSVLFKSEVTNKWCVPFPGSDKTVTTRSQLYNYNYKNERPAQIRTYFMPTLMSSILMMISGVMVILLAYFKFGRSLLTSYPQFFSLGMFNKKGPKREQLKDSCFSMVYWAEGWNEKLEPEEQHAEPPNKFMKVILNAPDAGYITTSICLVNAAIACLKESDKMPETGGVLTPGAAFESTSMLEKLQKSGFEFNIMEK